MTGEKETNSQILSREDDEADDENNDGSMVVDSDGPNEESFRRDKV